MYIKYIYEYILLIFEYTLSKYSKRFLYYPPRTRSDFQSYYLIIVTL